jgi:hypothetical protein
MQKIFNTLVLFLLIFNPLLAKEFPKMEDVPVKFNKTDQKKQEQANKLFNEGLELWNQLNTQYNPENVTNYKIDSAYNKDAYPLLMQASQLFLDANQLKLGLYLNNCKDFWNKHKYDSPSGLENAKKFEKEAALYYEKASVNRRVADNFVNKYVDAYNRLYEAISLEIIAIKKEGRALQIYRDWPAHFAYEWDEDIEANLFAVVPKVEPVKTEDSTQDVIAQSKIEVTEQHDSTIIYYSVQIAAHTIPMTNNYIRNEIYHGPMLIQEIREEGWYKYLIGHFKKADEAIQLLRTIHVEKAFVVAYRNGKRVPLKELDETQDPGNK